MPVITGTEGPDTLNDTAGDDVINALGGADIITVSLGGSDDVDGGGGTDRLIIDARVLGGSVLMEAPTQTANGLNGRAVWATAELDFLNIENFTIYTADANQRDIVTTGGGDDIFYHMPQASPDYLGDTIDLGGGVDTLIADFSNVVGRGVKMTFATSNANEVDGTVRLITSPDVTGVEKVGFKGVEKFVITGTGMEDVLSGRAGDDILDGGGADDLILGGGGNDMLTGGGGDDLIHAEEGDDILTGGEGRDHLDGGAGADIMTGGIGNDDYDYDNVNDQIVELAGEGTDTIIVSNLIHVYAHAPGTNIENIRGTSSSFDPVATGQTLIGNAENNYIVGGGGHDAINTGLGIDRADGGGRLRQADRRL